MTDEAWFVVIGLIVIIGGGAIAHATAKKIIPGFSNYFTDPWGGVDLKVRLRSGQGLAKVYTHFVLDIAYIAVFLWVLAAYS